MDSRLRYADLVLAKTDLVKYSVMTPAQAAQRARAALTTPSTAAPATPAEHVRVESEDADADGAVVAVLPTRVKLIVTGAPHVAFKPTRIPSLTEFLSKTRPNVKAAVLHSHDPRHISDGATVRGRCGILLE